VNKISGLMLGAARFVASGDLANVGPNTFLESSFTAVIEVSAPSAVKQVRLIAYPTADFAAPVTTHAVILKTRLTEVVSGTTWTLPTLWPDDPPPANPTVSTVANFIANVSNNQITLSIQYCTDPSATLSLTSTSCSTWHGKDFASMNSLWAGTKNAKQGVIVTWQAYAAEPDPHDSYLKENIAGVPTFTRSLKVKVLPVYNGTNGTTSIQGVSFSFLAPAVNPPQQLIGGSIAGPQVNTYITSTNWDTHTLPFSLDTSTNWSVTLIANVSFVTTSGTFANDTKLATHGRNANYTGT
jgi:hypothetical protein